MRLLAAEGEVCQHPCPWGSDHIHCKCTQERVGCCAPSPEGQQGGPLSIPHAYTTDQAPHHCPSTSMTQAPGLCLPFLSVLARGDRWELSTMAGTKYSKDGI